jgi:hypothetical protein
MIKLICNTYAIICDNRSVRAGEKNLGKLLPDGTRRDGPDLPDRAPIKNEWERRIRDGSTGRGEKNHPKWA